VAWSRGAGLIMRRKVKILKRALLLKGERGGFFVSLFELGEASPTDKENMGGLDGTNRPLPEIVDG